MASLINQPNGIRLVQFTGQDGQRRTIRLGKMPKKMAVSFKLRVESLQAHLFIGVPLDAETCKWLNELDDRIHERLANVGLVQPRSSDFLGEFLTKYLAWRTDLKPSSLKKLTQTKTKLLDFFDSRKSMRSISPSDASAWRNYLAKPTSNSGKSSDDSGVSMKLSEASIKEHCGNAKQFFNEAVRQKLITESPFKHLKSGATASRNTRYVTDEEADRIIAACPNAQWKLLFALARYAGLRVPSESHLLTWADVDWKRGRLNVRSPKTERHQGHEQRVVPITEELMPIIQEASDAAEDGQERLITMAVGGQSARQLRRICEAAGVESWKDAFQTLRRSCEKQWAMIYPQYAVSKWIGHSITVSGKHYANDVPDELYDRASASVKPPKKKNALQNAMQQAAA